MTNPKLADELTALVERAADKSTHMFKRMEAWADLTGLVEDNLPAILAALAENERLREGLEAIVAKPNYRCVAADMRKIARAALTAGASHAE